MRVALIGLPGAGKTTVFNAIAPESVDNPPGTIQTDTHVQVVTVRDERLDRCREIFQPKKFTPAGLEVWDPPGLPPGGSEKAKERRQRLLHTLRDADAYVLVVRSFQSDLYPYERTEVAPEADLAWLVDELLAADFVVADGRIQRLRENLKRGVRTKDTDTRELAVLEKAAERLEAGQGLKDLEMDEADAKRIRGYQFFARKPLLLLLNGPDANIGDLAGDLPARMRAALAMDAQLEAELAAMDAEERPAFQEEFGIEELAADRFVHEVYRAVGLISFFTTGEDEVRAWRLRQGQTALDAAAQVHTDLARGFVRAEVYTSADLDAAGGEKELKARGQIRLEPRSYVVEDGEIVHIRSNL